jgi:hypothetical protein
MPGKRDPVFLRPYVPLAASEETIKGAVSLVAFASGSDDLTPRQRKGLVDLAVWWVTGASGKYATRYRSSGVLALPHKGAWSELVHEHVYTRLRLVTEMLAAPADQREAILRSAVACIVTKDEHRRLRPFDKTHIGWDRYRAAGIDVYDMTNRSVVIQAGQFVGSGPARL